MKEYTVEQAADHAVEWCSKNGGWQRICDIDNSDALYETFDELPGNIKQHYKRKYGNDAEDTWREFDIRACKVPFGFVSGKGEFYPEIIDVPSLHNVMMVFKTS